MNETGGTGKTGKTGGKGSNPAPGSRRRGGVPARRGSVLAFLLMASLIAPPDTAVVSVKLFRFGPDTLLVRTGTVVTWRNEDAAPHTVTGEGFDLALPSKDSRASHRFTAAGTFAYGCSRHSFMRGVVRVLP